MAGDVIDVVVAISFPGYFRLDGEEVREINRSGPTTGILSWGLALGVALLNGGRSTGDSHGDGRVIGGKGYERPEG